MFVFKKARSPAQTLSDLDRFLSSNSGEAIDFIVGEVHNPNEFSYAELEELIRAGNVADLIDWRERYAAFVNEKLTPLWLLAIAEASQRATRGRITIDDSNTRVKEFLLTRGAELVQNLSEETRRAIAAIILHGQEEQIIPRVLARQIRPLIGLTLRQAEANVSYRQRVYNKLVAEGLSASQAVIRADSSALRYASKQHRFRAETIVHTELAFAYNHGAHYGIQAAQRAGLMGRCEMVWSTAGSNRVCSRCMGLRGQVVGYSDETGVTLPPIHPRCRCTIEYREVGTSRNLSVPEAQNLAREAIRPDNPPALNSLLRRYLTAEYVLVDETTKIPIYYDVNTEKIIYNPSHAHWKFYDFAAAATHEISHLIDLEYGFSVSLMHEIQTAVTETLKLILSRREHYERLLDGKLGENMSVSDLVAAITDTQVHGEFAHSAEYWNTLGNREREIVANLATIHYTQDEQGRDFVESFPKLKTLFEEVVKLYETSDNFTRRRARVDASRQKRTARRVRGVPA